MLKKGKNGNYLRPVGEVFRYKDKILEVVETDERDHCRGCFFPEDCALCYASYRVAGGCTRYTREDGRRVIFKEVKVETDVAGNDGSTSSPQDGSTSSPQENEGGKKDA